MHAAERAERADPDPKALACYGLWLPGRDRMLPRFVDGRPVSAVTRAFLARAAGRLAADGVRGLALAWDTASWPISREVRAWSKAHNRRVKAVGSGRRLLVCRPPRRSPPEPVAEPDRARVGARQARRGRAGARAHRRRTQAAALRPLPLPAPPAPRTAGLLNMH
jgi:hypothetical protein